MPDTNTQYILDILNRNQEKNFVKRILAPENYPSLDLGEGNSATHMMSDAEMAPNKHIVYPMVVQSGDQLEKLSSEDAYQYAVKTGEYLSFTSADQASWFAQNYKKVWENETGR